MMEVFRSNWIAPYGPAIDEFETALPRTQEYPAHLRRARHRGAAPHTAVARSRRRDLVFARTSPLSGAAARFFRKGYPRVHRQRTGHLEHVPEALEKAFEWAGMNGKKSGP